ncbi:flagellar filament capping protein FliD [Propionispora vibrioides]|uniref:Flagellar hook-associated protein 2 n=1 Tax=Propionispora vibrioides TaxID=112903 RepID=A0A1H8RXG5_9FIRM|nr:flagellar filament capping protein FliD [Propionispora vibrioides]SEO71065.1 flagellar hook-associated protein 2 [Propionispora vibrioides]
MSSSVSGTSSSVTRTYGLSGSGIDVDSMVEKLMTAARQPYTKMGQKQTILGWKKEAYNTLATSIDTFRNQKVFNFQMKSTLAAKSVTSSNSSVASVTATGDAVNVNHSIKVTQLASGVTQSSTAKITTGNSKSTLASQFGVSGSFGVTINGKSITVNSSQSINDLVSSINKADAGVTATYDATQDRFFLYTNATGSSAAIDFSGSSQQGLNFITNNLKLSAVSNITNAGVSSAGTVGFSDTAALAGQFSGLAGSFTLKVSVGTAVANIQVDTTKTSLNDIVTQINNIKDSSGNQAVSAGLDANGNFSIKALTSTPVSLAGSDPAAISFLQNQLKLGSVDASTPITETGVVSSETVGFNQKAMLSSTLGWPSTFTLNVSDGTTTKALTIDATSTTMESFLSQINSLTGADGKQMAVASFEHGKFTLKSYSGDKQLDLSGSDSGALSFMTNALKLVNQSGQDAQAVLDGVAITQSTNKFTVANVTYNLLGTGSSTVSIANDVDKIISSVKTFIDDYNTLLSSVNTKVSEDYDSDYQPLTDDQKKAMSDEDISAWTTKAKTGLLHNDSILKPMAESMRSAFTASVSGLTGKYTSAASIGIATGVDWTENGKLYVDEDTLRSALEEDPDVVYKIFGTTGTNTNENGIAVRLSNILKDASSKIVDQAGASTATTLTNDTTSVLGKQNKELTTNMTTLNKKLVAQENQYYSQFNAMEEALSKLSQQTSYLSSLLGNS